MLATSASMAAGPLRTSWIAPTLVKSAPLPAPVVKLENGTNTSCVAVPSVGSGIAIVADDQSLPSV